MLRIYKDVIQRSELTNQLCGSLRANLVSALNVIRRVSRKRFEVRILVRKNAKLILYVFIVTNNGLIAAITQDSNIVIDQLKKVAVKGRNHNLHFRTIFHCIRCDHIICFKLCSFYVPDFHKIKGGINVWQLRKRAIFLGNGRIICPISFIFCVQLRTVVFVLAIEQCDNVSRFGQTDNFQQRADETKSSLYGFAVFTYNA
ncbi:hypothetical protein SDC9_172526 [bioreactor metagenome]|uniref:Uncharacterized protein n=1 Tax=bioreactor metagenome TaxID=1076179 RepID=A0A645GH47_9ZZZZ